MFIKEYEIDLHRKIAEGTQRLVPQKEAEYHLETEHNIEVEYLNTSYKTIIYDMKKTNKNITLYSNTLNLNITNIHSDDGTPLYYYILSETSLKEDLEKDLVKFVETTYNINNWYMYYIDRSVYKDYIMYPSVRFRVFDKEDYISIRKLKDRFKIVIKSDEDFTITLGSDNLFEPKVHKNYLEFFDSILKLDDKQVPIISNSFEIIKKEEYLNINGILQAKDPMLNIEYIDELEDHRVLHYFTFKSNLLFDLRLLSTFYILLDNDNKIIISRENSPDALLKISKRSENISFNLNPYLPSVFPEKRGENYSIILEDNSFKYNEEDNILLGNTKIVMDLYKLLTKDSVLLETTDGVSVHVTQELRSYDVPVETVVNLPQKDIEKLDAFVSKLKSVIPKA